MTTDGVSPVPGAQGWQYGAFGHDAESNEMRIPLVRTDDGTETWFVVPDYVNDADDLSQIARVVISAVERWAAAQGVGA